MSRVCTIYRYDSDKFNKLKCQPENFDYTLPYFSLDKYWAGLEYIIGNKKLSRGAFASILAPEKSLGDIDPFTQLGMHPYISPDDLNTIVEDIKRLNTIDFSNRYNPVDLVNKKIYPYHWRESEREILMKLFQDLKDFLLEAIEKKSYLFPKIG